MCYNISEMKEEGYISLLNMPREQRDAVRVSFLWA